MKIISTRLHGMLDYLTAGALMVTPRTLGWSADVTRMMTGAALGTIGYSALTNYELGLAKILPMRAHLALDALSAALFCGVPLLFPDGACAFIASRHRSVRVCGDALVTSAAALGFTPACRKQP